MNTIQKEQNSKRLWYKIYQFRFTYILLLPALLCTIIFQYFQWFGVVIAFNKFDITRGLFSSPWVGFENFKTVFLMPELLSALKNTIIFSSVNVFLGFPIPIILALLLNELRNNKFKRTVQTISYLPHFLSWISIVGIFYAFFSLDGEFNKIRQMFYGVGTEKINILADSKYFIYLLFGSNIWKNVGWNTVIFLAAITGIDPSLYEAAVIDGCNKFKQILNITIPSIAPTIVVVLILAMGNLVTSNFEQVYGFQNVFIQKKTEVINTIVYRQGIQQGNYSVATAFGLLQGVVSFLLVFLTNKFAKKISGIGLW